MDELKERELTAYAAVDDALRTYPEQQAPQALFPAVMGRIPPRQPAPKFRLAWIDYALSLFVAMMVGLALLFRSSYRLPPYWDARLKLQVLAWWQQLRFVPHVYGDILLAGLALGLLAILMTVMLLNRGRLDRLS
jgi:hypothetical protein